MTSALPNGKELCAKAIELCTKLGAQGAIATLVADHDVSISARQGKVENLTEAQSASLSLSLFVDGRYGVHTTNELGEASLRDFLGRAIAATRLLDADADRQVPPEALWKGRAEELAGAFDASRAQRTVAERKAQALAMEAEARAAAGPLFVSATAEVGDTELVIAKVTSNGFVDEQRATRFGASCFVTLKDGDKRPEDGHYVASRFGRTVPNSIGKEAATRALSRVGQKKVPGGERMVLIENRAVPRLLGLFLQAASGYSLWQRRSFLEGKLDQAVMGSKVTLRDEPLLPAGLGSRRFDAEGLAARPRSIVEDGVLKSYNLDTYYARRLKQKPTSGSFSNLILTPGTRPREGIEKEARSLLVVNRFIGGNSNPLTGDFSLGIGGYVIEDGQRRPIAEMNLSGNHLTFWQRVVEVADDPWIYSTTRTPSLLIDKVTVA